MTESEPNILSETRASVTDIAAKVTGKTATLSAQRKVRRWIETGVTVHGQVVKLEAVRMGGKHVTSLEAFDRFMKACNERPALETVVPDRTPAQQQRDSANASKLLHKLLAQGGCRPLAGGPK